MFANSFRIEDIAGNALRGNIIEAANVALHVAPFKTVTLVAAILYPLSLVYAKVFVPWRHNM